MGNTNKMIQEDYIATRKENKVLKAQMKYMAEVFKEFKIFHDRKLAKVNRKLVELQVILQATEHKR